MDPPISLLRITMVCGTLPLLPQKGGRRLPVPGSLDKKEGRRFHLLLSKRMHLLPPFLFNRHWYSFTEFVEHQELAEPELHSLATSDFNFVFKFLKGQ
jgi:hypothetical protein